MHWVIPMPIHWQMDLQKLMDLPMDSQMHWVTQKHLGLQRDFLMRKVKQRLTVTQRRLGKPMDSQKPMG
ncbi:hypothetical protein A2897_04605 [Candidatus Woesebacteria bacterium RIFCSPLOWO2_01_FULL_44_24b]|nr:MAG: hypothetical protein A2897_04605 [Candidatus Woesebacteria bacterium RIFCSPLOWO2_01_FULL_44_24b]